MNSELIIPFGKFRGSTIEELPSSYFKWLADNCNDEEIMEAAEDEYAWRDKFSGEHK